MSESRIDDGSTPPSLTPEVLLSELTVIAHINKSFARGKLANMHVSVASTNAPDKLELREFLETNDEFAELPEAATGQCFEFEARHVSEKIIDVLGNKSVQSYVSFSYTMTMSQLAIRLPKELAKATNDISDSCEQDDIVNVSINSKDKTVSVCEVVVLRDSEGDEASVEHSCGKKDCPYSPIDNGGVLSVYRGDEVIKVEKITQETQPQTDNTSLNTDVDESSLMDLDWEAFLSDAVQDQQAKTQKDLGMAFAVLKSLKRAFREELGMNIRPTFPRTQE